jgi:peptidoglycan hydrolase-like protein with peptidoglycan-binding domain
MARLTIQPGTRMNGVSPQLLSIISTAAQQWPGTQVEIISGMRPYVSGGTTNHPTGHAIDVQLYDSQGSPIYNEPTSHGKPKATAGGYGAYGAFSQMAKDAQVRLYPGLSNSFAWGGDFGPSGKGGNAVDLMHFDLSGARGTLGRFGVLNTAGKRFLPGATAATDFPFLSGSALAFSGANPATGAQAAAAGMANSKAPSTPILGMGRGQIKHGPAVAQWQQQLAADGLYKGKVDSSYGPQTQQATRALQSRLGVTADGVAGSDTQSAASLFRDANSGVVGNPAGGTPIANVDPAQYAGMPNNSRGAILPTGNGPTRPANVGPVAAGPVPAGMNFGNANRGYVSPIVAGGGRAQAGLANSANLTAINVPQTTAAFPGRPGMVGRDKRTGQFIVGHTGIGGRPKGARSKLGEAFLEQLLDDFEENGIDAIRRCRETSPETYIRVIASLLPREIEAEVTQRFVARLPEPARTTEEWLEALPSHLRRQTQ